MLVIKTWSRSATTETQCCVSESLIQNIGRCVRRDANNAERKSMPPVSQNDHPFVDAKAPANGQAG